FVPSAPIRRPPPPTLLPYTTRFRSGHREAVDQSGKMPGHELEPVAVGVGLHHADHSGAGGMTPDHADVDGKGGAVEMDGNALARSEEHTSELQSRENLVCRLLLEKH